VVFFNYASKEITTKIVYYGPGLSGKTTNLQYLYETLPSEGKGKMLSLKTRDDRTLFFDFLPIDLGTIKGMRIRLQLCTVPGQVFYNSTRKLVLKGVDGVVFVADSQEGKLDVNLKSLINLEQNLLEQGKKLEKMPLVIQLNKRDLDSLMPADVLNAKLNRLGVPVFEGIATRGEGVNDALIEITRMVLEDLKRKHHLDLDTQSSLQSLIVPEPEGADRILKTRGPIFGGTQEDEIARSKAPEEEAVPVAEEGPEMGPEQSMSPEEQDRAIKKGLDEDQGHFVQEGPTDFEILEKMEQASAVKSASKEPEPVQESVMTHDQEIEISLQQEKETAVGVAEKEEVVEVPVSLNLDRSATRVNLKLHLKITFKD